MPNPTIVTLDVPSGEMIVGSDMNVLAPLLPGQGNHTLNTAQGQGLRAQAQAKQHLVELHVGDNRLQLFHKPATGELRAKRYGATTPRGFTPLLPDGVRNTLQLMDAADYDAQVQEVGEAGHVHARFTVPAGRYRFELHLEQLFAFEDEAPNRFVWLDAQRTGEAQLIVRRGPTTNAPHPTELNHTAMGQFLLAYVPRLLGAFPHVAQAVVEMMTGYGAGLRWHRGQLTDQAIPQADPPAWHHTVQPTDVPAHVTVPTFPALAALGSASVSEIRANGHIRSAILDAPLDADPYWLALGLVVLASIQAEPAVVAHVDPAKDAVARGEVTRGFRQLCGQITHADRWDEVVDAFPLLTPLLELMRVPAERFSLRRQALVQWRSEHAAALKHT